MNTTSEEKEIDTRMFRFQRSQNRWRMSALAVITASVMGVMPAIGQVFNENAKLLPNDGALGDRFGASVAISGKTVVVGSYQDQDNGAESGSAYIFDMTTGQQIFKLLPTDGAEGDRFGIAVAISGNTVVVGAYHDDVTGIDSGSAYLFDATTGKQIVKLVPEDGSTGDAFGGRVAIDGSFVVVASVSDDVNGTNSGSAYIFDSATGNQISKLVPHDGAEGDRFGLSVAMSGTSVIIGAYQDDDRGLDSGSAYIFDAKTGEQVIKLVPNDGEAGDGFGWSVAASGGRVLVGAPGGGSDNGVNTGSAYIFNTFTGQQILELLANDSAIGARFGYSVGMSGNTAVVGARSDDVNGIDSGSAYTYAVGAGHQIAKLLPSDGEEYDGFGRSVGINENSVVIGARDDDDNGVDSGSAYLFTIDNPCDGLGADLTGDGQLDFFDISVFLTAFQLNDPIADFNEDGAFDFFDASIFLNEFIAGCA
jgi:WD40 repeat protein